ncbi:cytidine deaminase [Rothia sp. P7181]|uniref:cytidine deaminase n=1 Tax=unclassified Rothia (in: high G+C Gram-positive bacteria) TaxID=2689056 RepID=UPI003ACAC8CD
MSQRETLEHPINWEELTEHATCAMKKSYSPYSHYAVGAAALTDDGRIITGCNVENASFGLTLCAECSLISELFRTGGGKILAFTCVDKNGEALMPCGRCRQLLYEHSTKDMLIKTVSGILSIEQMLPDAFGPERL